MTNGVHADSTEINQGILELGNCICTTGTDLVQLQSDFYAYSVLYNIIHGLPPFESSSKLLLTVVEGLQRGSNIGALPQQVQTPVVKILDSCWQRIARADTSVRPTSLSILLAPLLKMPSVPTSALMARVPAVELEVQPTFSKPPPELATAFMAYPNTHMCPESGRRSTQPDKRPSFQASEQRPAPDSNRRSDHADRDRTSRTSSFRSDAPTDPGSPALPDLSMENVRQLMSMLQSQRDKHTRRSKIRPSELAGAYLADSTTTYALGARVD